MHISTCEWGSPIYVCVGCDVRFLIYFIRNDWKTNGKLINNFRSAKLLLLLAAKVRKQEKNFSGKVELRFSSRRCIFSLTFFPLMRFTCFVLIFSLFANLDFGFQCLLPVFCLNNGHTRSIDLFSVWTPSFFLCLSKILSAWKCVFVSVHESNYSRGVQEAWTCSPVI